MIRMEAALLLIISFLAVFYFCAGRRDTKLHKIFSLLLVSMIIHLSFDAATIYTVNHLDTIPRLLNDIIHKLFLGTMVFCVYLFYEYIRVLAERKASIRAYAYLVFAETLMALTPVEYTITPKGNYSSGIHAVMCYVSVCVYLILCAEIFFRGHKNFGKREKIAIGTALLTEACVGILQALNHTWLISGMGLSFMTISFYLTLENPEILRSQLKEQKLSMLYLKSQVNPHFLYNTLDTIRIQAQLNNDKPVADMLMKLSDFFRLSVKTANQMTPLDDEIDLATAYTELMCCRYPDIKCSFDIDPELGGVLVPNFILQPIIENSFLHGLKNKGYRGEIKISAFMSQKRNGYMEISIYDSGQGFDSTSRENVNNMLSCKNKTEDIGKSIGITNVQKRIKLLSGKESGLSYTENRTGGVTAHLFLKI